MRSALLLVLLALSAPVATQAQVSGDAPPAAAAFWQSLGDPTLDRLVGQALEGNHDLRAVEARVREASATRVEAALDLAPSITAVGGYSRQRLSSATFPGTAGSLPDQNVWDAGVQMSWELDVFGRVRRSLQGRNALLASAEDDVGDTQVLLVTEVARAYFDLRGAQDRLAVARQNAENQRRTLELTQDRLELGRGNAVDTERAQAQLSSTLATIPALEAEIAAAQHRTGVLLGQPPTAVVEELGAEPRTLALPADLNVTNVEQLVRTRPDVRSAEQQHVASKAFVGAAKADYLPRLSIGATAGYTAGAFDALGNSAPRYAVGPVISWPLFDLGRVKTRVDAARAAEVGAAARYEQSILRALEEAETSLVSFERARERLQHLDDAAAASERATELARLRFEEGAADFLEVLDAERTLLEAQDRSAAGRTDATNWLVSVYRALGGVRPDGLGGSR
ncbi:MAG: efflux transporter outer membrane subunit [Longimicrobiales bacterium]